MSDSAVNSTGGRLGRLLTIPVALSAILLVVLFVTDTQKQTMEKPILEITREGTSLFATAAYIGDAIIQVYPGEWSDRYERGAKQTLSFERLNGVCIAVWIDNGKILMPKCGTGHERDPNLIPPGAEVIDSVDVPDYHQVWERFMVVESGQVARIRITRVVQVQG